MFWNLLSFLCPIPSSPPQCSEDPLALSVVDFSPSPGQVVQLQEPQCPCKLFRTEALALGGRYIVDSSCDYNP